MVDAPCSRVGHIYRKYSPFGGAGKGDYLGRNYKRVAAVWMDNFKHLYYDRLGKTGGDLADNIGDFGDVSERLELREALQCENFEWYLRNQMPELAQNKILGAGEIRCWTATIVSVSGVLTFVTLPGTSTSSSAWTSKTPSTTSACPSSCSTATV